MQPLVEALQGLQVAIAGGLKPQTAGMQQAIRCSPWQRLVGRQMTFGERGCSGKRECLCLDLSFRVRWDFRCRWLGWAHAGAVLVRTTFVRAVLFVLAFAESPVGYWIGIGFELGFELSFELSHASVGELAP